MKLLATVLTTSALIAGSAHGQVAATAKASSNPFIDNAYSNLDMRHYTMRDYAADGSYGQDPYLDTRITFGTKLLNEKLDMSYTFRFLKDNLNNPAKADGSPGEKYSTHADSLKMIQGWAWVDYAAAEGAWGSLKPYVWIFPQFGNNPEMGYVGAYYDAPGAEFDVGIGSLKLGLTQYTAATYDHDKNISKVEVRSGDLGLVGKDQTINTSKRHLSYELETYGSASLKIAAVPGLSVGTDMDYYVNYDPQYTNIAGSVESTELNKYVTSSYVLTGLSVGYSITDNLNISNKLYVQHGGFYQDLADDDRYFNRIRLGYTFF
jgi:hypothetical protein